MKKRLNKLELIELLKDLKIGIEEFLVVSSSSLVLRNLLSDAGDLGIAVTEKGLSQLKENYDLVQRENGWYQVTDKIECVLDTADNLESDCFEGYYLQTLEKYYEHLKKSTREKDKIKFEIVTRVLNENKVGEEK